MAFEDWMRKAAIEADRAVAAAMHSYAGGIVDHEEEITGVLVGQLLARLDGQIGPLSWTPHIMKHRRGRAGEEDKTGADLLIHVEVNTPDVRYSKGALIQAKRLERNKYLSTDARKDLRLQCKKMLGISPASYVFDYTKTEMRVGSASRIVGSRERKLYEQCPWTSYRFFWELFRCPIGDPGITSAVVDDLPVAEVDETNVLNYVELKAFHRDAD